MITGPGVHTPSAWLPLSRDQRTSLQDSKTAPVPRGALRMTRPEQGIRALPWILGDSRLHGYMYVGTPALTHWPNDKGCVLLKHTVLDKRDDPHPLGNCCRVFHKVGLRNCAFDDRNHGMRPCSIGGWVEGPYNFSQYSIVNWGYRNSSIVPIILVLSMPEHFAFSLSVA